MLLANGGGKRHWDGGGSLILDMVGIFGGTLEEIAATRCVSRCYSLRCGYTHPPLAPVPSALTYPASLHAPAVFSDSSSPPTLSAPLRAHEHQQLPMHFEAFTFVLTAGCWPLQSVSSSFKPPAPIEDYVVSFLDFYGEVHACFVDSCLVFSRSLLLHFSI